MRADRPRRRRIPALIAAVLLTPGQAGTVATAADEAAVGARVSISPLLVSLAIEPATARVGETVIARATVDNLGLQPLTGVFVEIRLDDTGVTTRGGRRSTIRSLDPGGRSSVTWPLCGRRPGTYLILAQATLDGVVTESLTRLLTILPGPRRTC